MADEPTLRAALDPPPAADQHALARMSENVGGILLGKPGVVELALVTLLARGHLLLEDIPGVGKTTLARALAQSVRGKYTSRS